MIIYKVTNTENGKIYIGKTIQTLTNRKSNHYHSANVRMSETNFHRSLRKHSKSIFKWEVIFEAINEKELNDKEREFISEYNSYKSGYNMTLGGDGGLTYKRGDKLYHRIKDKLGKWENGNPGATPEAIKKRVESFKDVDWPSGEVHGNYGHSHNVGILTGNKNPMYGKTPTNARKVVIDGITYPSVSAAARDLNVSPPTIRKKCKSEKYKNFKYIT